MVEKKKVSSPTVLQLYTLVGRGGDAVQLQSMTQALRAIGANPVIQGISPLHPYRFDEVTELPRRLLKALPWWVRDFCEWVANLVLAMRAWAVIRRQRPDFILERMTPYGPAGTLLSILFRIPLVVFLDAPFSLERQACGQSFFSGLHGFCVRLAARRARMVIVGSWTSRAHYLSLGVPEHKLMVLPNGIQEAALVEEPPRPAGVPVIGFVGSMAEWHRVELLLDAVAELSRRGRIVRLRLVGMGAGFERVTRRIGELGLSGIVETLGPVPHHQVFDQIDTFHIAVLPHTLTSGSPMKLFEYAARAIPAVAPDLVNIRDIWGTDTLTLFKPGDRDSLVLALEHLLDDPEAGRERARAGLAKVRSQYCWEPQLKRIIQQVLEESDTNWEPAEPPVISQVLRGIARAVLPQPVRRRLATSLKIRPAPAWPPIRQLQTQATEEVQNLPDRYDVLVLPVVDWHFRFQRPQQLARQFARAGHRVFYGGTRFHDGDELVWVRPLESKIWEINLPGSQDCSVYTDTMTPECVDLCMAAVVRLASDRSLTGVVIKVDLPFWQPLAVKLRERFGWKIVYDCMDSHADFSTSGPETRALEHKLLRQADLVLVSSKPLEAKVRAGMRPATLVRNGCDADHFVPPPADALATTDRPRTVGYFGAISDWLDEELVDAVARARPDWVFVFVGEVTHPGLGKLRRRSNVQFLGEQPYASLPALAGNFDVCWIPFKRNPLTLATNPVKVYEYLSLGKPVVVVPLPELDEMVRLGLIREASTANEFVRTIETALGDVHTELPLARRDFALRHTWTRRFAQIAPAIQQAHERVSVIILTYGNLNLSQQCLDSVLHKSLWPNLEVVVVDNGSTDGTVEYLRELAHEHPSVRLVLNDTNRGFAGGVNQGVQASTGEFIVILNNDTIVTRGWIGRLLHHLRKDHQIGMIGPVTNSIGNEARIAASYDSIAAMDRMALERSVERAGESFEIRALALFCTALRREFYDRLGGLDERFEVGMFEDDDLAMRVREAGYTLKCCEDVFVHHHHSASFRKLGTREYLRVFEKNRQRFEEKWGTVWIPHQHRSDSEMGSTSEN